MRRRRYWTDDEKRAIVAQALVPGVSVSRVARQHGMNANLLFKWLRDPRFRPSENGVGDFLPIEVVADPVVAAIDQPASGGTIEIVLPNGHRLNVHGAFDPDAVARLARGLCR